MKKILQRIDRLALSLHRQRDLTNTNKPTNNMITITNADNITAAFAKFQSGRDDAFPTCRCMPAPWDDAQEWAQYGEIEGVPVKVYYIFEEADVIDLEADSYDWIATSISKIEVAEKDEDGEFETL